LCNFFHSPLTSCVLGPNILLNKWMVVIIIIIIIICEDEEKAVRNEKRERKSWNWI
jgi:hypothetical protein